MHCLKINIQTLVFALRSYTCCQNTSILYFLAHRRQDIGGKLNPNLLWGYSNHFLSGNQECCHRSSQPKEREISSLIQALNLKASLHNSTQKLTHSLRLVLPATHYRSRQFQFAEVSSKLISWRMSVKGWGVSQLEDTSSLKLLVWNGLSLVWKWKFLMYCPKPTTCGNTYMTAGWLGSLDCSCSQGPDPRAGQGRVNLLCLCLCWKPILQPSSSSAAGLTPPLGVRTCTQRTVWFWAHKQTRQLLNPTVFRLVCWKHTCRRLKA